MRRLLLISALCGAWPLLSPAQTITVMTEQLAELEVFRQTTAQGYQIETTGVDSIGQITNDEFQLHQTYYGSLAAINPSFNNDARLTALRNLQSYLVQQIQADIGYWQKQLNNSSPLNNLP
jgi:hypothetical protein